VKNSDSKSKENSEIKKNNDSESRENSEVPIMYYFKFIAIQNII